MYKDEMIGCVIKDLSNQVKRAMDSQIFQDSEDAVSGTQGHIMGYLYTRTVKENQEVCQKDIERAFNIRSSSVTAQLQSMEKNGLITRETVEGDARRKRIVLTQKSVEVHGRIDEKIQRFEHQLSKGLSEEELNQFLETVKKIKKNLEEIN